jgi:hypothetical protein
MKALGGGAALVFASGCGYYSPEQGEAYELWEFPQGSHGI